MPDFHLRIQRSLELAPGSAAIIAEGDGATPIQLRSRGRRKPEAELAAIQGYDACGGWRQRSAQDGGDNLSERDFCLRHRVEQRWIVHLPDIQPPIPGDLSQARPSPGTWLFARLTLRSKRNHRHMQNRFHFRSRWGAQSSNAGPRNVFEGSPELPAGVVV